MNRSPGVQRLLDRQSSGLFGMTATEAVRLGCCVRCRKDVYPVRLAHIDWREWHLSGLCPACYADLMPEGDCE